MRHVKFKSLILLFGFMLPTVWYSAANISDGHSHITIKETKVQGTPRGSAINASLNGHTLTVVFSENLGQVSVEVTTTAGATVECLSVLTPNGLQCYIPSAGDYIVTFTLPNGDEYYGEFTVTD